MNVSYICMQCNAGGGRGHSLTKVTGGLTLRLLPRAVQQLQLLPGKDTTSHFYGTYTERRSASETATEFALLSF